MQNKVVRLLASGGVNRFRARFSQSLTDAALLAVFGCDFRFGSYLRSRVRTNEKTVGKGGRGSRKKTARIQLSPSPIAFWFNFGSAFALLYLLLKETTEGKKHTRKQTTSYAGYSERKECLRKTAISSHRHYFPLLAVWFFVISAAIKAITSGLILRIILQRSSALHQFHFRPYKAL